MDAQQKYRHDLAEFIRILVAGSDYPAPAQYALESPRNSSAINNQLYNFLLIFNTFKATKEMMQQPGESFTRWLVVLRGDCRRE
jgi:hypothetical protein